MRRETEAKKNLIFNPGYTTPTQSTVDKGTVVRRAGSMLNWVGHMGRLLAMPTVSLGQPQTDICICTQNGPQMAQEAPRF